MIKTIRGFVCLGMGCMFLLGQQPASEAVLTIGPAIQQPASTASSPTRVVDFPFYSNAHGFQSILTLMNNSTTVLAVSITAYNSRGEARELRPRTIPMNSPVTVNLAHELAQAPEDFATGNLQCRYLGPPDHLTGQMSVIDQEDRISFESEMAMGAVTQRLVSVVSVPSPNTQGLVALTNLGGREISVTYGKVNRSVLRLAPRATRVLEIGALAKAKPGRPALISLQHDGAPGDLSAIGAVYDKRGFSSTLLFVDPGEAMSTTLAGARFHSGPAPGKLGFSRETRFRSVLALANTSASATQAIVSVDYTVSKRENRIQLDTPSLAAGEAIEIELTEKLRALGIDDFDDAGVDVSYNGAPGAVIAKLTSVDEEGDLAFDTPVKDPMAGMYRSSGSHPWRLDGDFHTVLALKNVLPQPVNAMVVLRFDGGQYALPRVALEPFQTVSINLREVIANGKKDLDGNAPPAVTSGKVLWFQEEPDSLIGRAEIYSVAKGASASFSCFYPCNCQRNYYTPNVSDTYLFPSNITLAYLATAPIVDNQRRYECNNFLLGTFDVSSSTVYSSGNSGVFNFLGNTIQAVGVGSSTFQGQTPRNTVSPPACPVQTQASPTGSGYVARVTINSANVASNQISTTLSPTNLSGPFTLWESKSGSQDNLSQSNVTRSGGTYTDGFALTTSTPTGQYTTLYATWSPGNTAITTSYNYQFLNYGNAHQSQYTLINESTCSGAQTRAYIITNLASCFSSGLQTTTLESNFQSQVAINGMGKRPDRTYLKALAATSCRTATVNKPADASNANTFVVVPSVTGSCLQPLNSSTVAQFGHQCGAVIFISGYGSPGTVKTVQDECPRCGLDPPHFDNWTDAGGPSCGATVTDLQPTGFFVTERVQQ